MLGTSSGQLFQWLEIHAATGGDLRVFAAENFAASLLLAELKALSDYLKSKGWKKPVAT